MITTQETINIRNKYIDKALGTMVSSHGRCALEECGKQFIPSRVDRIYCSTKCTRSAYRKRMGMTICAGRRPELSATTCKCGCGGYPKFGRLFINTHNQILRIKE